MLTSRAHLVGGLADQPQAVTVPGDESGPVMVMIASELL